MKLKRAIKFNAETTNKGIIIASGTYTDTPTTTKGFKTIENEGLYVKSKMNNLIDGTILVTKGFAYFHTEASNSGTLRAIGKGWNPLAPKYVGLVVYDKIYNSMTGNIYVTEGLAFSKNKTINLGLICVSGADNNGHGFYSRNIYNSGAIVVGNSKSVGSIQFKSEVTNTGTIIAKGYDNNNIGLNIIGKSSKVYNLKEGSISVMVGKAFLGNELTNSGVILAFGTDTNNISLEVMGSIYNDGTITVGNKLRHGKALFHSGITNRGTIKAPAGAKNEIVLEVSGKIYNYGSIYAGKYSKTESMGSALFCNELTNFGVIYIKGSNGDVSLEVRDVVVNYGLISTCFSNTQKVLFHDNLVNHKEIIIWSEGEMCLEVFGSVNNFGTITSKKVGKLKLYQELTNTNSGEITIKSCDNDCVSIDVAGTVYNEGNITAGLCMDGVTFLRSNLINRGIINANGSVKHPYFGTYVTSLEVTGTVYNSGIISAGNEDSGGKALFNSEVTNTGTIIAKGCYKYADDDDNIINKMALEVRGTVYNSGTITVGGKDDEGSALFHSKLTNTGIIIACGQDNKQVALEVFGSTYNSGTEAIKVYNGVARFHKNFTNKGTVIAQGKDKLDIGLEVTGPLYNLKEGSISVTAGKLKLNQGATNDGYINSQQETIILPNTRLINNNRFIAKSLQATQLSQFSNDAYFDNLTSNAQAMFADVVLDMNIHVNNQGSVSLQAGSEISSYQGNQSSELVLTLPDNDPSQIPILKIKNTANFAHSSKVILAVNRNLQYLKNHPKTIKIITANQLNIADNVESLLYSRAYDKSMNTIKTKAKLNKLASNSIFVSITDATKTSRQNQDILEAKLQLVAYDATDKLAAYNVKLANSLLGCELVQVKSTKKPGKPPQGKQLKKSSNPVPPVYSAKPRRAIEITFLPPAFPITAPILVPDKQPPSVATPTITKPHSSKAKLPPYQTSSSQQSVQKTVQLNIPTINIHNSGIEHDKTIDTHYNFANEIIGKLNAATMQIFLKDGLNLGDYSYSLYGAIAGYVGKNKRHKWRETLIYINGEKITEKMDFGLAVAYLDCNMSTENDTKTKLHSYLGFVYAMNYINQWRLSYAVMVGRTNHKNKKYENKHTNEFSAIVIAEYRFIFDKFNLNIGIDSRFIDIALPQHKDHDKSVNKNNKMFLGLGSFIAYSINHEIFYDTNITAEVRLGYANINGIANKAIILTSDSRPQKHPVENRRYAMLRVNLNYTNYSYGIMVNFNHSNIKYLYGGNFIATYRF